MAGAVFGDVAVSHFVAGGAFGEIWIDCRSAKSCNNQYKMRCRGGKGKLCERTGSGLQFHGWIMVGNRPHIVHDTSTVFGKFFLDLGRVMLVAPRIVNDISKVAGINHACVMLRGRDSIWRHWRVSAAAPPLTRVSRKTLHHPKVQTSSATI